MKRILLIAIAFLFSLDVVLGISYLILNRPEKEIDIRAERVTFDDYEDMEHIIADLADPEDEEDPVGEYRVVEGAAGAAVNLPELLEKVESKKQLTFGMDVSKYQGEIDWKKVADTGIDFAMIRVGYRTTDSGVICEDPYAAYNLQEATKEGIQVGVYFTSTAITKQEVLEEAQWVLDYIEGYPITYPVAYCCEGFQEENRMDEVSKEERTQYASDFMKKVYNEGYNSMLYGSKTDLEASDIWDVTAIDPHFYIWVAQYPALPYPETEKTTYEGLHDMWQYTSQGSVDGIVGAVDLNIAYFSFKDTAKAKDPSAREDVTVSENIADQMYETVDETVTAKIQVNLRQAPTTKVEANIYTTIERGEMVTRVGVGKNGWSRIQYDGKILYAISSYLVKAEEMDQVPVNPQPGDANVVTEFGVVFDLCDNQVTAKIKTNLRSVPSSERADTVVATIYNGDWVRCTGVGRNGWSRIEYNGQILYAVTNYLTGDSNYVSPTQPPAETQPPTETTPPAAGVPGAGVETGLTFIEVNKNVTPIIEVNLRTEPSTEHSDTIVVKIVAGEVVQCTGESTNGWSRVIYNGQTLYGVTNYMKTVE